MLVYRSVPTQAMQVVSGKSEDPSKIAMDVGLILASSLIPDLPDPNGFPVWSVGSIIQKSKFESSLLMVGHKRKVVIFQPSIFKGELLVSGKVYRN